MLRIAVCETVNRALANRLAPAVTDDFGTGDQFMSL